MRRSRVAMSSHVCTCACVPSLLCQTTIHYTNFFACLHWPNQDIITSYRLKPLVAENIPPCNRIVEQIANAPAQQVQEHIVTHHFELKTAQDNGAKIQRQQQLQTSGNFRKDNICTTTSGEPCRKSVWTSKAISLVCTRGPLVSCMTPTLSLWRTFHKTRRNVRAQPTLEPRTASYGADHVTKSGAGAARVKRERDQSLQTMGDEERT